MPIPIRKISGRRDSAKMTDTGAAAIANELANKDAKHGLTRQ